MFSMSTTINDFEDDIKNCSSYYLLTFGVITLFSLSLNIILTLVILCKSFRSNNRIEIKEIELPSIEVRDINVQTVEMESEEDSEDIERIILDKNNPLPDWVIKEYLESKE